MRISLLTLSLALALAGSLAHADDSSSSTSGSSSSATPAADQDATSSPHRFYYGVGFFDDMIGFNTEVVTRWGNFAYSLEKDKNNELLSHFNWRMPIEAASGHDSGYYAGVFGGQIDDATINTNAYRLWGGGFDLGYHWVTTNTRSIVSVGLGATQKVDNNGVFQNSEPELFFTFNTALGAF